MLYLPFKHKYDWYLQHWLVNKGRTQATWKQIDIKFSQIESWPA